VGAWRSAHTRNEMGDARAWLGSGASAQPNALRQLTCYLLLDGVVNLFDHRADYRDRFRQCQKENRGEGELRMRPDKVYQSVQVGHGSMPRLTGFGRSSCSNNTAVNVAFRAKLNFCAAGDLL
jgi:hypothetical protein